MSRVFLRLLNMSLSSILPIAAVILLRLLLRKAPKALHCMLWTVIALRLICPILPESAANLLPDLPEITADSFCNASERPHSSPEYGIVTRSDPLEGTVSQPIVIVNHTGAPFSAIWLPLLTAVWLAGMLFLLIYGLETWFRLRQRIRPSICVGNGVWICDHIDSPFILGIFRPRIYLPSSLESRDADHVLSHERAHLRQKDHIRKPVGYLLLCVYWFNPVMWIGYWLFCQDVELACDEMAVAGMDLQNRKNYSLALLNCSLPGHMIAACPLAFGELGIKQRIRNILCYRKPSALFSGASILLAAFACVFFLTDPKTELPFMTEAIPVVQAEAVDLRPEEAVHHDLTPAELDELSYRLRDIRDADPYQTDTGNSIIPLYYLDAQPEGLGSVRLEGPGPREDTLLMQYDDVLYLVTDPDLARYLDALCSGKSSGPARQIPWDIHLTVESADANGATVVFSRDVNAEGIWYGNSVYLLQVHSDGQWQDLPKLDSQPVFASVSYDTANVRRHSIDWQWLYGTLPAGLYRIGKPVTSGDARKTEPVILWASFSVGVPDGIHSAQDDG